MDLRALRYFVETVRQASFTRAADVLCVTQSTISKMIRQLEEEVGAPLLIREGRMIAPTDTGRIVFERGQQALALVRQLSAEVQDVAALDRGELHLGIPPTVNLLFTGAIKAYRQAYPGIRLVLREEAAPEIEQRLAAGELEVGATVLPVNGNLDLTVRTFGRYPICAVSTRDWAWNGRKTLELEMLREVPLLMLTDEFSLTRSLRQAFALAGIEPVIATQSTHWEFLAGIASAGLGVALLPEPLLRRMQTDDLSIARLVKPSLYWQTAHVWPRDRYLSHAARAWLQVCQQVMGGFEPPSV
ncbi:MAG: LysR family transcriptional regulator [Corticimicrobacter sp.]|uniref:LysR family transcriptional regulator n=1 Tax=Corticimicrobacter sp. TaxID=2678536 RepID=UPI0032DB2D77